MSGSPTPADGAGEAGDCTTTGSFADHGVEDGYDLVTETHRRLAAADTSYEPTAAFFDRLEEAFLWAYLGSVEEAGVPAHVEAAIEDAKALTVAEFEGRPDADLRTDVIPSFYRRVAAFHCTYRDGASQDEGDRDGASQDEGDRDWRDRD